MITFRIICAVLMAWAISWAFGRAEAGPLLQALPQIEPIGLACAAWIGAFSLAVRQGWGMIVALSNGVWAGVLSIALSGLVYMMMLGTQNIGTVGSFERWLAIFEADLEPVFEQLGARLDLMGLTILASALVGLLTEAIHWGLVRLRRDGNDLKQVHGTASTRRNPTALW